MFFNHCRRKGFNKMMRFKGAPVEPERTTQKMCWKYGIPVCIKSFDNGYRLLIARFRLPQFLVSSVEVCVTYTVSHMLNVHHYLFRVCFQFTLPYFAFIVAPSFHLKVFIYIFFSTQVFYAQMENAHKTVGPALPHTYSVVSTFIFV